MYMAHVGRIERLDSGCIRFHCHTRRLHCPGGPGVLQAFLLVYTLTVMQSQWFVIHTLSGQEQKVKESIEKRIKPEEMGDYIKEVLVPMEKVVEVRNQKKTVSTRKL